MNETFKTLMVFYCMDVAPEWSTHAAVDGNGDLYVYNYRPVPNVRSIHTNEAWGAGDGHVAPIDDEYLILKINKDLYNMMKTYKLGWKETLIEL